VVLIGPGIWVGVVALSGLKIVLNPWPVNVPVKADSGPSVGGRETGTAAGTAAAPAAALNTLSTWWMAKFAVLLKALVSGLGSSTGRSSRCCKREAAVASPNSARRRNFSKLIAISWGARPAPGSFGSPCAEGLQLSVHE